MTVRRFQSFFVAFALLAFGYDSRAYAQNSAIVSKGERISCNDITSRLTSREREIAALVARGHSTKYVVQKLKISELTVATYLRRIFSKLGVR
jgi:DNA-binding NarL/FixJ family response regulator